MSEHLTGSILPALQTLYPVKETLAEAVSCAMATLPIETPNQLTAALMTYHNTLLAVQSKGNNHARAIL